MHSPHEWVNCSAVRPCARCTAGAAALRTAMYYPEHGARGGVASHGQASEKHTRQEASGAARGPTANATGPTYGPDRHRDLHSLSNAFQRVYEVINASC